MPKVFSIKVTGRSINSRKTKVLVSYIIGKGYLLVIYIKKNEGLRSVNKSTKDQEEDFLSNSEKKNLKP